MYVNPLRSLERSHNLTKTFPTGPVIIWLPHPSYLVEGHTAQPQYQTALARPQLRSCEAKGFLRPAGQGDTAMPKASLTVLIPIEQWDWLHKEAARCGVSLNQLFEEIVRADMDRATNGSASPS